MPYSLPVTVLVFLGAIVTVLGLFAAGDMTVVVVGLLAVFGAGLLHALGDRRTA